MCIRDSYDPIFVVPEPHIGKKGAKIMSLQDPTKKMSKSDEDPKSFVSILDPLKKIQKKVKSAVTDSDPNAQIVYDLEAKPGLANLLTIYSVLSGNSVEKIESEFTRKMYGHLKVALADLICETFAPVQERYQEYMQDLGELENIMHKGAVKARKVAQQTLREVYGAQGLVLPKV